MAQLFRPLSVLLLLWASGAGPGRLALALALRRLDSTPPISTQTTAPGSPAGGAELIPAGALGDIQAWAGQQYQLAPEEQPASDFVEAQVPLRVPELREADETFGTQSFTVPNITADVGRAYDDFALVFEPLANY